MKVLEWFQSSAKNSRDEACSPTLEPSHVLLTRFLDNEIPGTEPEGDDDTSELAFINPRDDHSANIVRQDAMRGLRFLLSTDSQAAVLMATDWHPADAQLL